MCRTRVPGVCICDEGSASGNNNSVESQKRRETRMHARWECSFTWMISRSFCEHTCVHARTVPFPTYQPAKRISGLTRSGRKEERSILGVLGGSSTCSNPRAAAHSRRQTGRIFAFDPSFMHHFTTFLSHSPREDPERLFSLPRCHRSDEERKTAGTWTRT